MVYVVLLHCLCMLPIGKHLFACQCICWRASTAQAFVSLLNRPFFDLDSCNRNNSWVAVFQFFITIPLAVPAALAGNPAVSPMELPRNLWDGWLCYLGYDSVVDGDHPDDCWPDGPLYVTLYLVVNIAYNILITLVRRGRRGGGRDSCGASVMAS